MKLLVLFSLVSMGMVPAGKLSAPAEKNIPPKHYLTLQQNNGTQTDGGSYRMPAVAFKAQEFCRAELKDFEFDAHFDVVGATVYFTGANFSTPEKGFINSNSLKPIKKLMDRCTPGTIIIFDDVKVVGPDKEKRTIEGATFILY